MKIIEISKLEFDKYAYIHKNKSFYQTSQYGTLMSKNGFNDHYIALIDDKNNIIAASLILIQRIVGSFKFAYSPRGFLINFSDSDLLESFVKLLKEYLNKKGVLYLKIDPNIVHIKRDKNLNTIDDYLEGKNIINNLINIEFEHKGYNLYFETLKPRWNCIIDHADNLIDKCDKNTRNRIKAAIRKGVYIEKGNKNDIKSFYNLVDKKHTRKFNYYLDYFEIFGKFDMFEIYTAKMDVNKFIQNSKMLYEKELEENNNIVEKLHLKKDNFNLVNKKIASDNMLNLYKSEIIKATKLCETKDHGILAATAIIKFGDEIFFLIDGINNKYKDFNANYLLKHEIIDKYSKKGYRVFNLNGISGDFDKKNKYYGLYDFKSGFNANVIEYIGEFDIVINKINYTAFNNIRKFENLFNYKIKKN